MVANAVQDRLLADRVVDRQTQRTLGSRNHERGAGPLTEQRQQLFIDRIDRLPLPGDLCVLMRLVFAVRLGHGAQYTAPAPRRRGAPAAPHNAPRMTLTQADRQPLPQRLVAQCAAWRGIPFRFQLESAATGQGTGRLSVMGVDPFAVLTATGRDVDFFHAGRHQKYDADPFEVLDALLAEWRFDRPDDGTLPPIAVGYFGYDLGRHLERLPQRAVADQDFPDMVLGFYDRFTSFDHQSGEAREVDHRFGKAPALSGSQYKQIFRTTPRMAAANFTRESYVATVQRAQQYIAAGDIYQVNLSQRFAAVWNGDPYALYRKLSTVSPAPYASFFELGNRAVLSASPELFLDLESDRVITRPIKGTRPRGENAHDDARLANELLASVKDEAELTMIVDLQRNDLGRVCLPGSVHVVTAKTLEQHPSVWHLVATVEGRLPPGSGPIDLLRASFPGGSITGAPKIRAMEIIDELEPTRRAVYTGAIGMLPLDGRMTLSIAIRTMLLHGTHVTFQAGGAITADSDPIAEYEETLIKARALARSIESSLL